MRCVASLRTRTTYSGRVRGSALQGCGTVRAARLPTHAHFDKDNFSSNHRLDETKHPNFAHSTFPSLRPRLIKPPALTVRCCFPLSIWETRGIRNGRHQKRRLPARAGLKLTFSYLIPFYCWTFEASEFMHLFLYSICFLLLRFDLLSTLLLLWLIAPARPYWRPLVLP